jgi:hypothetical protein
VGNQTYANVELIVVNSGSKASPEAKIQFFLSEDTTLNRKDITGPNPENPSETIVLNPKDQRVMIGSMSEVSVASLQPGGGVRYIFAQQTGGDTRLKFPVGENGSGLNLLAHFQYSDPLADHLPIHREVVFGPFDPFVVTPTSVTVKEAASDTAPERSATFKVRLRTQPDANVTIPLSLSATDAAQIEISPATSLVFTAENWNIEQVVTVKAKDDAVAEATKTARVTLGVADSTDPRFDGMDPSDYHGHRSG